MTGTPYPLDSILHVPQGASIFSAKAYEKIRMVLENVWQLK
jgi:hypothetical protein